MKEIRIKNLGKEGFSLAELMVATFILIIALVGILISYLKCLELNEFNKNSSYAVVAAKNRMEQIKDTDFTQLVGAWNDDVFSSSDLGELDSLGGSSRFASGVSYVDSSVSDLYEITVSVCWRQKSGRVIGEDLDLDGVLDAGEDVNGNGMIDSPVQLITLIFDK
jgi:Tfp pilus assembly protein PilV